MTNTKMKPYAELNEAEKAERRAFYEAQREQRGTVEVAGRLTSDAIIKELSNGAKMSVVTVAVNKKGEKAKFITASAYIEPGKDAFEAFHKSLKKGQFVTMEYKLSKDGKYNNIWNIFAREVKAPAKAQA